MYMHDIFTHIYLVARGGGGGQWVQRHTVANQRMVCMRLYMAKQRISNDECTYIYIYIYIYIY